MKVFCYRSGHVFLGTAVPSGAIELADHPNEAELLRVVRWHTAAIEDEEGNPVVVLKDLAIGVSDESKATLAAYWIRVFRADLRALVDGTYIARSFTAKPIEVWSESSIKLSGRIS